MKIFNKNRQLFVRKLLRKNSTEAERLLWQELREFRKNGHVFRRQYGIGKYVADFCCPKAHLVIELDGASHGSPEAQQNDVERQKNIEALGLKVARFSDQEVFTKLDDVIVRIRTYFTNPTDLPPYEGGNEGGGSGTA